MRLRILELPPDDIRVTTPFAVVLDALGARSALIFQERVELDGDRR